MLVDHLERLAVSQRFRKYQPNGSAKTNKERSVDNIASIISTGYYSIIINFMYTYKND